MFIILSQKTYSEKRQLIHNVIRNYSQRLVRLGRQRRQEGSALPFPPARERLETIIGDFWLTIHSPAFSMLELWVLLIKFHATTLHWINNRNILLQEKCILLSLYFQGYMRYPSRNSTQPNPLQYPSPSLSASLPKNPPTSSCETMGLFLFPLV